MCSCSDARPAAVLTRTEGTLCAAAVIKCAAASMSPAGSLVCCGDCWTGANTSTATRPSVVAALVLPSAPKRAPSADCGEALVAFARQADGDFAVCVSARAEACPATDKAAAEFSSFWTAPDALAAADTVTEPRLSPALDGAADTLRFRAAFMTTPARSGPAPVNEDTLLSTSGGTRRAAMLVATAGSVAEPPQ